MAKILLMYRDIINCIEENGFDFNEQLEDSQLWVKLGFNGEPDKFVEVPFNTGFYSSKALKQMINQSGIPESEWLKWCLS